jgi:hypothetical protein
MILALVAVAFVACASPSDQLCTTEQKCNLLTGQTVTQCQQTDDKCVQDFNNGNQTCQDVAAKWNTYASCAAPASCSDVQNPNDGACSSQWSSFTQAAISAATLNCPLSCFSNSSNMDGGS